MCHYYTRYIIVLMICSLAFLYGPAGCTQHNYKKEADEKVYKIIDRKWRDDFGTKANYKVSDTEPSMGDIRIAKAVPASGVLTLPQAVAIATANTRDRKKSFTSRPWI